MTSDPHLPPPPPNPPLSPGSLEKWFTWIDGFRLWFENSGKIAMRMLKGAYLLSERRRLFAQLGELVHAKAQRGEFKDADLDTLVHQLDRLSKKVDIEERLIRKLRFEDRNHTPSTGSEDSGGPG